MHILVVGLPWLLAGAPLLVVTLWWYNRHIYRLGSRIPGSTPLPLVGNLHTFMGEYKNVYKNFIKSWKIYGDTFRIHFGPYLLVFLSKGNDIDTLTATKRFNTRDEYFLRPVKSYLGDGLVNNSGEKWKRHHKIMTPTFNNKVLETFIDIFNKNSQILVNKLESFSHGTTFDVYTPMALASLDMINETVLGVSIDAQLNRDNEFVKILVRALDICRQRYRAPWLFIDWIFNMTKIGKEEKAIVEILNATVYRTISTKLEEFRTKRLSKGTEEEPSIKRKNVPFLELIIETSEMEGEILSPLELRDEVSTLAIAGLETTATTSSFVLSLLSIYPEHQQKVVLELQTVFGDDLFRPVTPSDLNELTYLEMVIKETLRLYPPIAVVPRVITEDVKLSSCTLPAGTTAFMSYITLHRNPKHFPDPEKFDPDRFLPEAVAGRPFNSYMPFGMGPRKCIGSRYAMIQIKTVLSHVLRRYEVLAVSTREDIDQLEAGIVMKPVEGYKLKMRPRTYKAASLDTTHVC